MGSASFPKVIMQHQIPRCCGGALGFKKWRKNARDKELSTKGPYSAHLTHPIRGEKLISRKLLEMRPEMATIEQQG